MFGQNPIRHRTDQPDALAVQSVFYTLQGEGPFSGCPATFIRLAGCNLACHFCDTEFESGINNLMAPADLADLALAQAETLDLVVLTGGEPLRQNIHGLMEALLAAGFRHVQVETAGTLWDDGLLRWISQGAMSLVVSPKTPMVNRNFLTYCRHWKYIVKAGELDPVDGLPNRSTQIKGDPARIFRRQDFPTTGHYQIWISPCDEQDIECNKANVRAAVEVCLRHGYRLSLQIHKLVGVE